jgi:protein phosphatase 1 regulatory subunit 10
MPSRPTVKKEAKPLVTAVKDAKSDSSFFSAPKPKPKLPSFKKAPAVPVKMELGVNVAQPSSIDPFQEALKSMAKAHKGSPAASTPPPVPTDASSTTTGPPKIVKKKKSVTWAPEGQLELIKLIEKAIYDDDPVDVSLLSFNHLYCVLMSSFGCTGYTYHTQLTRFGPRRRCRTTCPTI